MKTLFVCLVTFLFAFIIGCQESSITDPVKSDAELNSRSDELNYLNKDFITANSHIIMLDGRLKDPTHSPHHYPIINGYIKYSLGPNFVDKKYSNPFVKLNIYVNARLKSSCPHANRAWIVNEKSVVVVNTSLKTKSLIEKSFKVKYTCCGNLNLVLTFSFTRKQLSLESMRLVKVRSLLEPEEYPISE